MRTLLLTLLLAFLGNSTSLNAQKVYLSEIWGLIYEYNVSDCSFGLVVNTDRPIFDIAFHPNGNLYGLSNDNMIFEIDTITGTTTDIYFFGSTAIGNSMAIDGKGEIFIAGTSLLSYNISTGKMIDYGALPAGASGDLLFYKGDLFVAISNNKVIEINLDDLSEINTVVSTSINIGLWGLFSLGNDCNDLRAFGVSGGNARIYELNFQNQTLDFICDVPFEATGAAGTADNWAPEVSNITITSSKCDMPSGSIALEIGGGLPPFETYVNNESNNGELLFSNLPSGEYELHLIDSRACELSITLDIFQGDCPIYFPNVFSPNNDGYNDTFYPSVHPNFKGSILSYSIFDRWGNKVKSSDSPLWENLSWNGQFKNRALGSQVFVYVLEVIGDDDNIRQYQGEVSILR